MAEVAAAGIYGSHRLAAGIQYQTWREETSSCEAWQEISYITKTRNKAMMIPCVGCGVAKSG